MVYTSFYANFYVFRQTVKTAFAALWRFTPSRLYLGIGALFQIIVWLQAIFIYQNLSGELLVLHYSIDFGINLVGAPRRIFIYPLYGLGVFALNWMAASALYRRQHFRLFASLLLIAALLFSLLVALALMFVYLINFR